MRVAATVQARLLELQEVDTALSQAARRAATLPENAALAESAKAFDALRSTAAERLGALEDARAELARLEADTELVLNRIERDNALILNSGSVKDVQGLTAELESLRRRQGELEDSQIVVMEQVELAEQALAEAEREHAALAKEREELEAAARAQLLVIQGQRDELQQSRAQLVEQFPAELVALYEKQRERYGTGASFLRAKVTSATGVTLTEADLVKIRQADPDEVLLCPDSNAILIRTAESGL